MGLLRHTAREKGFHTVFEPAQGELRLLGLGILSLSAGESWEQQLAGREAALVMLGGRAEVWAEGRHWAEVGARENVFAGPASALYLPAESRLKVSALQPLRAAVITAPATNPGEPLLITPEQVTSVWVGRGNTRRTVQTIVGPQFPASRLLVGETYSDSGCWSSYPPHKHDRACPGKESQHEEIYYYLLDPPHGFALQRRYSPAAGLDEAYVIKDGDALALPCGYHPVVVAPGYRLYYLWALAGEQRVLLAAQDPALAG